MHGAQLTLLATALAAAGVAMAQNAFSIATPTSLVTCQPYRISWTGGVAPFFPIITQPMQVGQIIKAFPQTNEQSVLWTVDLPAGTTVTLAVNDSNGQGAASAVSPPIVAGSVTNCPASSSSSVSASSSSSASVSSSSSSSAAASSTSSASRSNTVSASSSSSSTRPAATSVAASPNAAGSLRSSAAVVAVFVGAVAAALA